MSADVLKFRPRSLDDVRLAELMAYCERMNRDDETLLDTLERILISRLYEEFQSQTAVSYLLRYKSNAMVCRRMKKYGIRANAMAEAARQGAIRRWNGSVPWRVNEGTK